MFKQRKQRDQQTPVIAALYMVCGVACFAVMVLLVRLVSAHLHIFEIVFYRNFFALIWFAPIIWRYGIGFLASPQMPLHLLRGVNGVLAMTAFFLAITLIPLAEATALGFTTPLFATIGAILFLGERVRWRRWLALGVGFFGVALVLGPQIGAPSLGAALALLAAALIGAAIVMVKQLTKTDSPAAIAIWMVALQSPLALVPMLFVAEIPSWFSLGVMMMAAAFGSVGHLAWTKASSMADVSQLQPLEFLRLPIVATLAYIFFNEMPTIWTWVGGGVIFVATTYVTWREAQLSQSTKPASTVVGRDKP